MQVGSKQFLFSLFMTGILLHCINCAGKHRSLGRLDKKDLNNWVCIYNENASPKLIQKFDLAVLDADAHPDLAEIRKSNTILIGYVSLGEVGEYRWFWNEIADKPWILEKNPNWDSHLVDVRAREWHDFLVEEIIPEVLAKGFDGIFLDTIDTAAYLEKYHPAQKYPGAQDSMSKLIRAIRANFPAIYIIANRGFAILDEIGSVLDGVVAESLFTTVDVRSNELRFRTQDEYNSNVRQLKAAKKKFNLAVFTLDYYDGDFQPEIKSIIADSRKHKFIPFISTRSLDKLYFHTLEQ